MSKLNRILAERLRDEHSTDGLPVGALSSIFEEEPPSLERFLYETPFLGLGRQNIQLSSIQTEFIRYFEQVLSLDTYIAMVEQFGPEWAPVRMCHTITACWGKGGGKDMVARYSIARVSNILLSLNSPQGYYGLPETDEIQMLNVAVSALQARRAFFKPLRNMLVSSSWFSEHFRHGPPSDAANNVLFKKNIELISGHSQAESQEGLNLIAAIADEIGAFKTESEQLASAGRQSAQTAEYIVDMLRSSASTRFPDHFKVGIISYPRYENDAMMQAVAEGRKDNDKYGEESTYYLSGPHSTWDVNPRVSRNAPEIVRAYNDDPEYAAAKYECQPPKASNRYIRSDAAILQGFTRQEIPAVTIDYFWGLPDDDPNDYTPDLAEGWQVRFTFADHLRPMEGAIYALHGDIAIRQDRAGIAMAHVTQWRTAPGEIDPRAVVRVDLVAAFEADLNAEVDGEVQPREVQIRWYRKLVSALEARGFDIARVTFDGFQSLDMIQQFTERNITSEVVSLDRNTSVYDTFRATLYDSRVDGPYDELLIDELQKLSRVKSNKVDHLPGGSKDLSDAVAGAVYGALIEGGNEGEEPTPIDLRWANAPGSDATMTPRDLGFPDLKMEDFQLGADDWSEALW